MFKNIEKKFRSSAVFCSCLAFSGAAFSAQFSCDNSASEGPGSLKDVVLSSNAISPQDQFNAIIFRDVLKFQHPIPILRQNVDLKIPKNLAIELNTALISSVALKKSGQGDLNVFNFLESPAGFYIDEGSVFLNGSISKTPFINISGKLVLNSQNPIDSILKLSEGGTLEFVKNQELTSDVYIDRSGLITASAELAILKKIKGYGELVKLGNGTLKLEDPSQFRGKLKIIEGNVELNKDVGFTYVELENATINYNCSQEKHDYVLILNNSILDLNQKYLSFKRPLQVNNLDSSINLNDHHLVLAGLGGEGNLKVLGGGVLELLGSNYLNGNLLINKASFITQSLDPKTSYIFNDSKLYLKGKSVLSPESSFEINEGGLLIEANSFPLYVHGDLRGNGKVEASSLNKVYLNSSNLFEGHWLQKTGLLDLNGSFRNIKVARNAEITGYGVIQDFTLEGTWRGIIEFDSQTPALKATKAVLDGAFILNPKVGYYAPGLYPLLEGDFSSVNFSSVKAPAQFEGEVIKKDQNVFFKLNKFYAIQDLVNKSNPDNLVLAKSLDSFFAPAGSEMDMIISDLLKALDTPNLFAGAVDSLQPAHFSALGLEQESNFILARSSLTNRMQELISFNCAAESVKDQANNLWIDPVFDLTRQKSTQNDIGYMGRTWGVFAGYDKKAGRHMRWGLSLGYTHSDVDWQKSSGNGLINSAYLATYLLYQPQRFYLNASLNGGYSHYDAARNINFIQTPSKARHKNHGWGYSFDLEVGYVLKNKTHYQPYLRQSIIGLHQKKFTEKGAGSLDLKVGSKSFAMYRAETGLVFNRCFNRVNWAYTPELNLSAIYELELKTGTFHAEYVQSGQSFDVTGMKPIRFLFSPGLAFDAVYKPIPLTMGLRYHAELGNKFYDQRASAHFSYGF